MRHLALEHWYTDWTEKYQELLGEYCACSYVSKSTEDEYLVHFENVRDHLRGEFGSNVICAIYLPDDAAALKRLPQTLTLYRGFYEREKREGISWSLSRRVAEGFAYSCRYVNDAIPQVVTGTCSLRDVLAYTNDCEEQEVIINPKHVRKIKNIEVRSKPPFPVSAEPLDVLLTKVPKGHSGNRTGSGRKQQ